MDYLEEKRVLHFEFVAVSFRNEDVGQLLCTSDILGVHDLYHTYDATFIVTCILLY